MWFIGVEVEQEMSAPPPNKNPGSAPTLVVPQAIKYVDLKCFLIMYRVAILCDDNGIWADSNS